MKIEEYRSRWGYENKAFKVEFWNLKPHRFSIKTVKHSSFYLHSIHQKKIGVFRARSPATEFDVPWQIHDTTSVSEQMQLLVMQPAFSFSMRHSSLVTFEVIMSTLHTFLLSSVAFHSEITTTFCPSECPAECCCDLGVECWMLFWSRRVECYCDCTTRNFRHTNDDFRARCDWLISATTTAPLWTSLTEN